ncbi:unnamed protein product [Diabrotica balteata]|uniref:Uncharacterized protein n=1 Tax=Diabrotica balteata TaxID=107213 RepID=A0A9N9TCR4_DIABA|nr:unnamed protein product [Diabrotica balteata]
MLEESNLMESASSADVFLVLPDPIELTIEDSVDEDCGGTFNNLNKNMLDAESETVIHQEEDKSIYEENINLYEKEADLQRVTQVQEEEDTEDIEIETEIETQNEKIQDVQSPTKQNTKTSFSPTLARLLTAPERSAMSNQSMASSTPMSSNAAHPSNMSISEILSTSKACNEITITPVDAEYNVTPSKGKSMVSAWDEHSEVCSG